MIICQRIMTIVARPHQYIIYTCKLEILGKWSFPCYHPVLCSDVVFGSSSLMCIALKAEHKVESSLSSFLNVLIRDMGYINPFQEILKSPN